MLELLYKILLNVAIKSPFLQMELHIGNPSPTQSPSTFSAIFVSKDTLERELNTGSAQPWATGEQRFLVTAGHANNSIINFVFLCFVCLIPSLIISWRLYLAFWRVKTDRQITFKYEACANLSECLTRSLYFQNHKNKHVYHVRMCSNFIWQLRLWFGYALTFIGNSASWVWLWTEHS